MKKESIIVTLLLILGLLSITVGVSIAFFNYTRTGQVNNIGTGRIYFTSSQSNTLNITNVFPVKISEVDSSTLDAVTISIEGDTTYADGEEYLISLVDINNTINNKKVPINYIATYTPNTDGVIGTDKDYDYWEERKDKDTSIYLLNATGSVVENAQVLVGFITSGATGINGSITIKAYVDADRIAITDTPGENSEWRHGRVVFSTEEWNSFQSTPLSFKIRAESNEGLWVQGPTDCECFDTLDNGNGTVSIGKFNKEKNIYTVNNNMTREQITSCAAYIENFMANGSGASPKSAPFNISKPEVRFLDTSNEYEAFCLGTGKLDFSSNGSIKKIADNDDLTFKEALDNNIFTSSMLEEMMRNNYIIVINLIPEVCNTTELIIPKKIGGNLVTTIVNSAFSNNQITSVEIPNSVTKIESYAFSNNQLTSVVIPYGVTTIGKSAFSSNQLTSVEIPNSVTKIEDSAFSNNQLTSVIIPNGVTTIGVYAFMNNQLTDVQIPNSVTTIGNNAFVNNSNLENISINMTTIPAYFASNQGISTLTNLTIGNSVTTIGAYAFNNNKLTGVTIGNSVTTIGYFAFSSNQLTSVTIPNNVTTIGNSAFSNNLLTNITISNNVTVIESSTFSSNRLTSVEIPNSVTTIGNNAFSDNLLISMTIPNSITMIGSSAFFGNQLTSVTIPNSVTTIGNDAFGNNRSLTTLNIDMTIIPTSFAYYQGISTLKNLTIGNSVTAIGGSAFIYNQLISVTISNNVTEMGKSVFYKNENSNPNLASITINKSCSSIKGMYYYPWLYDSPPYTGSYSAGTTIYGANNEVCDSW